MPLMFCMLKTKKIYPAYVSKDNSNREKQYILLMISNGEKGHYLAVKKLSALLRGITSKNNRDFCFIIISFRTKNKLECHRRACENKDFCSIIMPNSINIRNLIKYHSSFMKILKKFMDVKMSQKIHLQQK